MKQFILLISLFSLIAFSACKSEAPAPPKETPKPLEQQGSEGFTMDTPPIERSPQSKSGGEKLFDVSDEIQSVWSAVELEVIDKETDKREVYTVKRGEEVAIKGTELKVTVTHFIPNFTMGGGIMTSLDSNPENPAVALKVTEGGKEIWNGITFMQFPDTHAFEHDTHAIIMKNYIAK